MPDLHLSVSYKCIFACIPFFQCVETLLRCSRLRIPRFHSLLCRRPALLLPAMLHTLRCTMPFSLSTLPSFSLWKSSLSVNLFRVLEYSFCQMFGHYMCLVCEDMIVSALCQESCVSILSWAADGGSLYVAHRAQR